MRLFEVETTLYHVTYKDLLPQILENGLKAGSYWSNREDITEYYKETITDEGKEPIVISLPLTKFNKSHLQPDYHGIEEPLTFTLKMSEDEVWEEWEKTEKTWKDSLDLIGTVRYDAPLKISETDIKGNVMDFKSDTENPKVIMLVGPPASGKSTWTEKFLVDNDDSKWVVLGTDRIIDNYAEEKGITYTDAFNQLNRKKVESKFKAQLQNAFKNNINVIWDQTNTAPNARRKKLAMIPDHYEVIAMAFEVDRDELDRRLENRFKETGKFIPDHVVDNMIDSYVRPSKSEGFSDVHVISS